MKTEAIVCVLCGSEGADDNCWKRPVHSKCTRPTPGSELEAAYAMLSMKSTKQLRDLAKEKGVRFTFTVKAPTRIRKFFHDTYLISRLAPMIATGAAAAQIDTSDDADDAHDETPAIVESKPSTGLGIIEARVAEIAREVASQIAGEIVGKSGAGAPAVIEWKVNDVQFAKVEGTHHAALTEVLETVRANFHNLYLVGPAGTGKSTLGADLARALRTETFPDGLPFAEVSCSGGLEEWQLLGRSLPDLTTGKSIYHESQFVHLYENGGVFLVDEIDAADANVLVVLNSALANGHMAIPSRTESPVAHRHPDFYLLAAANTFGNGANMKYQGRNALDGATLDRFVGAIIPVDYDRELEAKLVPEETIRAQVWAMRDRVEQLNLRRIVGTRALIAVAKHVRSGKTLKQAVSRITVGWTSDEVSKVCAN
jgi:cobaltochelatase CobS